MQGGVKVRFGASPSGGKFLGDCPVIGFEGKGCAGPMRVKRFDPIKRRKNKARRQAIKVARKNESP